MTVTNHYEVLGVPATAPLAEIQAAHRAQMREHHPEEATGSQATAQALNEALRVLQDARLRAAYDAALASGGPAEGTRGNGSPRQVPAQEGARGLFPQDPAQLANMEDLERIGIRLSAMGWHNREYLPLEIRQATPRRSTPPRISAWVLLGFLLMLTAAPAVLAARNHGGPAAALPVLALVVAPALVGGWARARRRGRTWSAVPYILFLGYAGGFLVPALAGGPGANAVPLAWLGTYMLTVEAFRATGTGPRRRRARRLLEPQEILRRTHWEPVPAPAGARPGTHEVLTGQLLGALHHLPGSRTIHPLALPGDPTPWPGHGVLCGGRLALIDTVQRPDGEDFPPEGGPPGKPPGREAEGTGSGFALVLREFIAGFPGLEVRGWSVFHGVDNARMPVEPQGGPELPRPVSAETMLREVGDWLAGGQPHVVDRQALSELVLGPAPGPGTARKGTRRAARRT